MKTQIAWNPWHGCEKISEGCKYCYVYRQDDFYNVKEKSSQVRKNASFDLPIKTKRDKSYKIPSGSTVYTCFTSDFLVEQADFLRIDAWNFIKQRQDLTFVFFTKRIERFNINLPEDWNDGYDNVVVGCTVENQKRAEQRLPIFKNLPIKHKIIIVAPMLEKVDLSSFLDESIELVAASGESGNDARVCYYDWILDLRNQCIEKNVAFNFHQTGAKFIKDRKFYRIKRQYQISQARKANIDYNYKHQF